MTSTQLLEYAQRLQAIAQAVSPITEISSIWNNTRSCALSAPRSSRSSPTNHSRRLFACLPSESGYQTRKVDVRAVMFRGVNEILLVQEKSDHNNWTLPGGWADVGCTPFEASKEAEEENWFEDQACAASETKTPAPFLRYGILCHHVSRTAVENDSRAGSHHAMSGSTRRLVTQRRRCASRGCGKQLDMRYKRRSDLSGDLRPERPHMSSPIPCR